MANTSITIRVPVDLLEGLRAAASQRGVTLTELLLGPWRPSSEAAAPSRSPRAPRSPTAVVVQPRRERVDVVSGKRRFCGFDAITKAPIYR
jgi:hypothetical protein